MYDNKFCTCGFNPILSLLITCSVRAKCCAYFWEFCLWLAAKCCKCDHTTSHFGRHLMRALLMCTFSVVQSVVGCVQAFAEPRVLLNSASSSGAWDSVENTWVCADTRSLLHARKACPTWPSVNVHDGGTLLSGACLCARLPPTCLRGCIHEWGAASTGAVFFPFFDKKAC